MPGGGLCDGESAEIAVVREVYEETGLVLPHAGLEVWTRTHEIQTGEATVVQHERYFLVQAEMFEPRAVALDKSDETDWFREFRWWSFSDLPQSSEHFAPTRIGELLRHLLIDGPPSQPVEIPE